MEKIENFRDAQGNTMFLNVIPGEERLLNKLLILVIKVSLYVMITITLTSS